MIERFLEARELYGEDVFWIMFVIALFLIIYGPYIMDWYYGREYKP